ncbi:MAG: flagellar basal body rod protein FlgB [Acetobacteraceae bacterium]
MNPLQVGLFDLAQRRLSWAEQRQALLAKNIANASTPGYRARDLPSFARTLRDGPGISPVRTQPNHLATPDSGGIRPAPAERPRARAPDGNAVTMDEQLSKVAETESGQTLVTTIYRKYMQLFSLALGKG